MSVNEDTVYFVSNRRGFYELYSMGLNGKNLQKVSNFDSLNKILILSLISKNELLIKFENDPNNNLYVFSIRDKLITRKI